MLNRSDQGLPNNSSEGDVSRAFLDFLIFFTLDYSPHNLVTAIPSCASSLDK